MAEAILNEAADDDSAEAEADKVPRGGRREKTGQRFVFFGGKNVRQCDLPHQRRGTSMKRVPGSDAVHPTGICADVLVLLG